ncbi:MAG: hypothetical protein GC204_01640 [Chloroflexi bacterium]|nr:hypothetical protein [Chloroflexota bacterium]
MDSNVVYEMVRRSNRRMLILAIVGIVAIAVGVFLDRQQVFSFISGPQEMATQELVQIQDADSLARNWVTVKGSSVVDTGWQNYTAHDVGPTTINASYLALTVGKRFLLLEVPGEVEAKTLPETFTGALKNIPSDISNEVIDDIRQQSPSAAKQFLPIMLDTADYRNATIFPVGIFLTAGIVVVLALLYMWLRRTTNPLRHPYLKALARYGDPKQLSETISYEMNNAHTQVSSYIHVTPHWLVFNRGVSFQVAQLREVTWAYQKVIQHKTYGINTRKTFEVNIWDQTGKMIAFIGSQNEVVGTLRAVAEAADWVVIGYSSELDQKWRKSRAEFIEAVKQRRDQS